MERIKEGDIVQNKDDIHWCGGTLKKNTPLIRIAPLINHYTKKPERGMWFKEVNGPVFHRLTKKQIK
jgi:hypothetical protein